MDDVSEMVLSKIRSMFDYDTGYGPTISELRKALSMRQVQIMPYLNELDQKEHILIDEDCGDTSYTCTLQATAFDTRESD